jgi:hypothetical protein
VRSDASFCSCRGNTAVAVALALPGQRVMHSRHDSSHRLSDHG